MRGKGRTWPRSSHRADGTRIPQSQRDRPQAVRPTAPSPGAVRLRSAVVLEPFGSPDERRRATRAVEYPCQARQERPMGDKSAIEWTEATWNPVTGCSKVSPGCAHCYAEAISLRFGHSRKPWTPANAAENVILHQDRLD